MLPSEERPRKMTTFRPLPSCHSYLAPHIFHSIDLITNVQQSFWRFFNHCSQLASILISNLVKQSNIKLVGQYLAYHGTILAMSALPSSAESGLDAPHHPDAHEDRRWILSHRQPGTSPARTQASQDTGRHSATFSFVHSYRGNSGCCEPYRLPYGRCISGTYLS